MRGHPPGGESNASFIDHDREERGRERHAEERDQVPAHRNPPLQAPSKQVADTGAPLRGGSHEKGCQAHPKDRSKRREERQIERQDLCLTRGGVNAVAR